jgi:predicted nucleic acid-binding protein
MAGVIVLDAGIVIAYLNETDAHHAWVVEFLSRNADQQFSVSALTHAEYLVGPTQVSRVGIALKKLLDFNLDVEEVTEQSAVGLARVRAETRLRMPDAVVLHTALDRGACLATTDRALAGAARIQGIIVHSPS